MKKATSFDELDRELSKSWKYRFWKLIYSPAVKIELWSCWFSRWVKGHLTQRAADGGNGYDFGFRNCPVCGALTKVKDSGKFHHHGPHGNPCRGSGSIYDGEEPLPRR